MGRTKEWGMEIMEALEAKLLNGRSLKEAVQEVTDDQAILKNITDREWLANQVQAVVEDPELYQDNMAWWNALLKYAYRGEELKAQAAARRKNYGEKTS